MRNIKPIYLMCESGVELFQIEAILAGIYEVLRLAGVSQLIKVYNLGVWRNQDWRAGGVLLPYQSVDWYVRTDRRSRTTQVNGASVMVRLKSEPWQDARPHYDVVVLRRDMYSGEDSSNFVIGLALPELGTVVSINRFLQLEKGLQAECIKTEVMHEVGHIFGLIPENRQINVEDSLGKHCTNVCSMRQGLRLPDDWVAMTRDRLRGEPFCGECKQALRQFFQE